jgi:hypothetical protein
MVTTPGGEGDDAPGPDELTAAWGSVLDVLKGGTRGMFHDGRFEASSGGPTVLTVPKGPPLDQLEKRRPEVEAALAAHFGRPVPLRVVVGADAPAPPGGDAPAPDDHVDDVHELEDAPSAGSGVDRLAEAFPGSELVEE